MLKYLKKYWFFCILAPLFMVGEVAMDLLQPDLMARIVDEGVLKSDMNLIITVGVRMILTVMIGGVFGILCGVFANLAAQSFGNDLRKDLFRRIMGLSFQQTDKISTGSLVTRLTNDVTQVQNMVQMAIRGFVRNSVMFIGGVYMLYRQSPKFALVAACGLPLVALTVTYFLRRTAPLFAKVQKKLDGINNIMQETVAGARVVKAYVKEDYELGRFDEANDSLCAENLRVTRLLAFMGPCMNIVLNLCVVAVIMIGGYTAKEGGTITPGNTMAAITYLAQILHGVMFMANIFQIFSRAKASADRINEVLNQEQILTDGPEKENSQEKGTVEFRNVSFAYPGSEGHKVLDSISFRVGAGQTLAIIGATGSGKSSLVHLIPRFYEATEGEVLVDGVNVRDYKLQTLRSKLAVVLQKAELYSRSIGENISWSKKDAKPEEIKAAATIAQADDFICRKSYGYHTPVTEGGHSLSGGQKQRLSIARAILKDREILIFDDSTSALDLKTEADLYAALEQQCPGVTKIIVAQRIASIRNADRILVLENGTVGAMGTHKELMKSSELYRDIYHSQLKEGGEEQ
ncbi:MAG: ABC transporter ATP-binding protein [Oscillospiraceae bacterium]|nr:ABC transporter ATP-binding protein [Oscillospiraceae bacterium]